jgi:hypothetical protein
LVLDFNCCLTTEYSETTAHFNGNFDTDEQIYVPYPKGTATFQTHCINHSRNLKSYTAFIMTWQHQGINKFQWHSRGQGPARVIKAK